MRGRSYEMFITTGLPAPHRRSHGQDRRGAGRRHGGPRGRSSPWRRRNWPARRASCPRRRHSPSRITSRSSGAAARIRLLFLGRAHTGGDIVVFLPKERLVITGDLLVEGTSYIGDGFTAEWPATLEKLRALDFDVTLPGHGRVFRGKAKIDHFQAYLRDFRQQAEALHRAGVPAEAAAAKIDLRKHGVNYPAPDDARRALARRGTGLRGARGQGKVEDGPARIQTSRFFVYPEVTLVLQAISSLRVRQAAVAALAGGVARGAARSRPLPSTSWATRCRLPARPCIRRTMTPSSSRRRCPSRSRPSSRCSRRPRNTKGCC
jgi:glyoxylase-like metal-dependent hydrolase (beta-lactamase superfamily II)